MITLLRKIKCKTQWSRQRLADELGVTSGAISNYEYGSRYPKPALAYKLIDIGKSLDIHCSLEDVYPREQFNTKEI
jgi:transcriptional regulator with XRE-family HTH domain